MPKMFASRVALVAGAIVGAAVLPLVAVAPAGAATAVVADGTSGPFDQGGVVATSLEVLAQADAAPSSAEAKTAAGFAVSGGGSPLVDGDERVAVSVRFVSADAQQAALPALQALGAVRSVTQSLPTVVVYLPTSAFETAAALDGVVAVSAATQPHSAAASPTAAGTALTATAAAAATALTATGTAPAATAGTCRTVPVNSDAPLKSDVARAAFGVDGTGVTVGILSNSFDALGPGFSAVSDEAQDIAAGSLPGPGNPCGYPTAVKVLADDTPADDEGRAMAQTVHGIAPGATLLFASAGVTEAEYADRIQLLVDNGARVLVDDDVLSAEPWFQQGVIAQKIAEVRAQGVLYLSAAQNQSSIGTSGAWEGRSTGSWEADAFTSTSCPTAVTDWLTASKITVPVDCNDFGGGSTTGAERGELGASVFAVTQGGEVALQWAQPTDGIETVLFPFILIQDPKAGTATDPDPWVVASALFLPDETKPSASAVFAPPADGVYQMRIVVARVLAPTLPVLSPRLKLIIDFDDNGVRSLDRPVLPEGVTVGPSVFGHPSDPAVFTVGAASALHPSEMEPYSGTGPVQYYFGPVRADAQPADALTDSTPHAKPDITSVDEPETTFFNQSYEGHWYFGGTSAAAPNAAGVAALALQYSPQSSADAVQTAMERTAAPMPAQAWDYGVGTENWEGAGLLDAAATLAALPAAQTNPVVPAGGGSTRLADTGASMLGGGLLAALAAAGVVAGVTLRRRARA